MKKTLTRLVLLSLILFNLALPVQANELDGASLPWNTKSLPIHLDLAAGQEIVTKTIQVDADHYITVTLKEEHECDHMRTTIRRKLTVDYTVLNVTGRVIGTLTVKGTFDTNGSTSTPVDVYGYGSVVGYDVQNTDNSMGSPGSSSWVSSTLVCVPLDYLADFSRTCTITCDANGNNSASWN